MKKTIALFSLLFPSIPSTLFAHLCIDVGEFDFSSSTGQKGLRISFFDTDEQSYKQIDYSPYPTTSSTRTNLLDSHYLNYGDYFLNVIYNKNVSLQKEFNLKNYIIRTQGEILLPPEWTEEKGTQVKIEGYNILYDNVTEKTEKEITSLLSHFGGKAVLTPKFTVSFDQQGQWEPRSFSKINPSDIDENSRERGKIGELPTDLTMASYGCFIKYYTQNGSNHGLDGAYTNLSNSLLILTESKCRGKDPTEKEILEEQQPLKLKKKSAGASASKYLEKEMNEKEINRKVDTIIDHNSKGFIKNFINTNPQHVLKGVHRILPTGKSQWAIEYLDNSEHLRLTTTKKSSEQNKINVLSNTMSKLASSKEEKLRLSLQAIGITLEEAIQLLPKIYSSLKEEVVDVFSVNESSLLYKGTPSLVKSTSLNGVIDIKPHNLLTTFDALQTTPKQEIPISTDYSEVNYKRLLTNLKQEILRKKLTYKTVTGWSDFSGSNGGRDFESLKSQNNLTNWNLLRNGLEEKGYLIEDLLKD